MWKLPKPTSVAPSSPEESPSLRASGSLVTNRIQVLGIFFALSLSLSLSPPSYLLPCTIFLPFLSLLLPFFPFWLTPVSLVFVAPPRPSCSLPPSSSILFSPLDLLTRSLVYIALRPIVFPPSNLTRASTVLSLCHALTSFSSVFQLSLFRPLHLSASPAATSSSDLLSDRSTSGTVLLSRCFLFLVNKGSEGAGIKPECERWSGVNGWGKERETRRKLENQRREELVEKKINRDSCQPKKFDYVGSAEATLG